ncbi:MAG: TIGR02147 family protein [Planctomycetota bacterium]
MKRNATQPPARPESDATRFRLYLQAELARRCATNPQYSLRAFALDLDIDHATLSQLLRGKRTMTAATIERLGARLKLGAATIRAYIDHEQSSAAHDRDGDPDAPAVRQLANDAASLISDWYHYAILELVRLDSFRPDSRWIARVLGITVDEVNVAVSRLLHLDLLQMAAPDRWIDKSGHFTADMNGFAAIAVQRLLDQVNRLARHAIDRVPDDQRAHSSTTIAINSARLPEALDAITTFHATFAQLIERDARRDDVYQLEINLFPLTTLKQQQPAPDQE